LIDDGSTDGSKKIIELFLKKSLNKKKYKFISYKKNVGKGYALSRGVSLGNKDWILTCDIDFSVKLEQIINWEKKFIKKDLFVYFGSRMHSLSTLQKNYFRNIIGSIFKLVVYILFKLNISDTQCGFKLYKKKIAKKIKFSKAIFKMFDENDVQIEKINYLEKIGIKIKTMYIIGFPEETKDKFLKTVDYAIKVNSSYAQFSVFTPYPGTPVYKEYEKKITATKFEDFNQWKLVFKHKHFDEKSVRYLLDLAYKKYYLRLSWIKNILMNKLLT